MSFIKSLVNLGTNVVRSGATIATTAISKSCDVVEGVAETAEEQISKTLDEAANLPREATQAINNGVKKAKEVGGEAWDSLKELMPEIKTDENTTQKSEPQKQAPKNDQNAPKDF